MPRPFAVWTAENRPTATIITAATGSATFNSGLNFFDADLSFTAVSNVSECVCSWLSELAVSTLTGKPAYMLSVSTLASRVYVEDRRNAGFRPFGNFINRLVQLLDFIKALGTATNVRG